MFRITNTATKSFVSQHCLFPESNMMEMGVVPCLLYEKNSISYRLWVTSRSRVPVDGAAIVSDVRGWTTRRYETHERRRFFPDKDKRRRCAIQHPF
ncbi:hypothetical protein AVEN_103036-1 [Araneus ventricosus]|uniref:Uncharacterized protein n=1 Tax=Araneus ventricosus TaxID=182803 RepID=A0A4Y2B8J3_ARAVE|nr:hypothetical protein AVEN_103036-1 [Araneus ventricosus]